MKEVVNAILKEKKNKKKITSELTLGADLGLDSLNLIELIVELEERLHIEINESDLDPASLQTVGQVYALAEKYTEG